MLEKETKKTRIMLIFPPVTRPEDFSSAKVRVSPFIPLGLAYIAASLEKKGIYEIKILDALIEGDLKGEGYKNKQIRYGMSDEQMQKSIQEFNPDIIGISCLFAAMEKDVSNILAIAKAINKNIKTILGGANASSGGKRFIETDKNCDYVLMGEGDLTFIELINAINENTGFDRIGGLMYRENEAIKLIPKTTYIENLDSIPFPARHLLSMDKYLETATAHASYKNKPFTPMISSRGCPAKCTFCSLANHWGKIQRKRSATNILDEIEHLIKEYGIKEIHFEDDNLTADKKRALQIFNGMIERKFNISWVVPSGMAVFSLDDELLEKMKESGCYSVSLAIENANQHILTKLMNKPVNLTKVKPLVDKIRSLGMDARGFFILGFPGETKEDMNRTIEFAKELELDWAYFFIFSPLPETNIYKTCIEKGCMKESDFDPLRSFHEPAIVTEEFDQEYLKELRETAIVEVNFKNNANLLKYDINKAIASFKQVVDIYPHFDFANFALGEAYLKNGEEIKAKMYFQKTLELNPNHSEALIKLKDLETLMV
jgi:anaerobic magnesium-protoporphyrin IX monomethyl ester cyclase